MPDEPQFSDLEKKFHDALESEAPQDVLEALRTSGGTYPTPACLQPHEVETALTKGELPPERNRHVATCDLCRILINHAQLRDSSLQRTVERAILAARVHAQADDVLAASHPPAGGPWSLRRVRIRLETALASILLLLAPWILVLVQRHGILVSRADLAASQQDMKRKTAECETAQGQFMSTKAELASLQLNEALHAWRIKIDSACTRVERATLQLNATTGKWVLAGKDKQIAADNAEIGRLTKAFGAEHAAVGEAQARATAAERDAASLTKQVMAMASAAGQDLGLLPPELQLRLLFDHSKELDLTRDQMRKACLALAEPSETRMQWDLVCSDLHHHEVMLAELVETEHEPARIVDQLNEVARPLAMKAMLERVRAVTVAKAIEATLSESQLVQWKEILNKRERIEDQPQQAVRLRGWRFGILTRVAAIGEETTGWQLEKTEVEGDSGQLSTFDGKRVGIYGELTTRNWRERGPQPLLKVRKIVELEPPAGDLGVVGKLDLHDIDPAPTKRVLVAALVWNGAEAEEYEPSHLLVESTVGKDGRYELVVPAIKADPSARYWILAWIDVDGDGEVDLGNEPNSGIVRAKDSEALSFRDGAWWTNGDPAARCTSPHHQDLRIRTK